MSLTGNDSNKTIVQQTFVAYANQDDRREKKKLVEKLSVSLWKLSHKGIVDSGKKRRFDEQNINCMN